MESLLRSNIGQRPKLQQSNAVRLETEITKMKNPSLDNPGTSLVTKIWHHTHVFQFIIHVFSYIVIL